MESMTPSKWIWQLHSMRNWRICCDSSVPLVPQYINDRFFGGYDSDW